MGVQGLKKKDVVQNRKVGGIEALIMIPVAYFYASERKHGQRLIGIGQASSFL